MKRALFAVAVGFMGLTMMGCATGVVDSIPPSPAPEESDPPQETLSAELQDPQGQQLGEITRNRGVADVPPERAPVEPPIPTPTPYRAAAH
jgi:hypothetical protein